MGCRGVTHMYGQSAAFSLGGDLVLTPDSYEKDCTEGCDLDAVERCLGPVLLSERTRHVLHDMELVCDQTCSAPTTTTTTAPTTATPAPPICDNTTNSSAPIIKPCHDIVIYRDWDWWWLVWLLGIIVVLLLVVIMWMLLVRPSSLPSPPPRLQERMPLYAWSFTPCFTPYSGVVFQEVHADTSKPRAEMKV